MAVQSRSSHHRVSPHERCIPDVALTYHLESLYSQLGLVPTLDIEHPGFMRNAMVLQEWIHECEQNHNCCQITLGGRRLQDCGDFPRLPTRVIEVTAVPNPQGSFCVLARLVLTNGKRGQYLTLSHRWSPKPFQLLKENIDALQKTIPTAGVPLTFTHAMLMTKLLGFQYIWIDSLCIIQDDSEDRTTEICKMGEIFENAACMLAAVDTVQPDGSDSGLFERTIPGPAAVHLQCRHWDESDFGGEQEQRSITDELGLKIANPQGWFIIRNSEWHGRGWVMQERMLSRRTIYFTKYKMMWDCRQGNGDEDRRGKIDWLPHRNMPGEYHQPYAERAEMESSSGALRQWNWLVEEYSKCQLTKESDKSLAIEGIRKRFERRKGAETRHGILTDANGFCVPASLLWIAQVKGLRPYREFTAPSWSWLGHHGSVDYSTATGSQTSPHRFGARVEGDRLTMNTALGCVSLGSTVKSLGMTDDYIFSTFRSWTRVLKASRSGPIIGWVNLDCDVVWRLDVHFAAVQCRETNEEKENATPDKDNTPWTQQAHVDVLVLERNCSTTADGQTDTYRRIGCGIIAVSHWLEDKVLENVVVV
jgi:hypothetical protein